MHDLLPAEMGRFRRLEQAFREVCLSWGYQEVRTPTIEYLHLFTAAGTLSPQMLSRVYSFLDWDGWSGERVVLRPDATIPTVRLFLEHLAARRRAKLFYVQNVFRFSSGEQPREVWQCGVELIGEEQPGADVELVLVGCQVLERLGLGPAQAQLSHPGLVRAVLARAGLSPQEQGQLYDSILEGDLTALRRVEEGAPELALPARLLSELGDGGREYLANLYSALVPLVPEAGPPLQELMVVCEALDGLGCDYRVTTGAVGRFEYYTGPVVQFVGRGQRVGGGGRYDHLIAQVGGADTPATGFALDVETLLPILRDGEGQLQSVTVVASATPAAMAAAMRTAQALHQAGIAAAVAPRSGLGEGRWELSLERREKGWDYLLRDAHGGEQRYHDLGSLLSVVGGDVGD